jgi:hypothetical protein
VLEPSEAEVLLQAWGRFQLEEIEQEVGYPSRAAGCGQYTAPVWSSLPPGPIRPGDIERACWVMIVLSSRQRRLWRDLRDHYRDGARLGYPRLDEGRRSFALIWEEWGIADQPTNPL